MAQQISDVVLVYLSPSQLCRKSAPQVVPDQTGFNVLTTMLAGQYADYLSLQLELSKTKPAVLRLMRASCARLPRV